jgi:hypothetical protein
MNFESYKIPAWTTDEDFCSGYFHCVSGKARQVRVEVKVKAKPSLDWHHNLTTARRQNQGQFLPDYGNWHNPVYHVTSIFSE